MGAWGYGLFQSDADLDKVDEISDEAGKLAKDPKFTFWYPENKDEVVGKLNNGLYHQLLQQFQGKKWDHGVSNSYLLGALPPRETLQLIATNSCHVGGLHDGSDHEARCYHSGRRP